jgi:hypothetical protein
MGTAPAESRNRLFHALRDRMSRPDALWQAWEGVRSKGGSAGVGGETIVVEAFRDPEGFQISKEAMSSSGRSERSEAGPHQVNGPKSISPVLTCGTISSCPGSHQLRI